MNANNTAHVRVLHAVPDAPNVDVYSDGALLVRNIAFGDITGYLPIAQGTYEIAIYPTGTMTTPVVNQLLTVNDNQNLTIAAIGMLNTISGLKITDSNQPMQGNNAMVRFIHLSPNAPAVDITLPDGTIVFKNISYMQGTNYAAVPPSTYTLQVKPTNTSTVVLTVPNVAVEANKYYTIYALGLVGKNPELQALAVMDY